MNCISCGVEVSPAFKYAFSQNICPACGGTLIDEESLALIEDLGTTLSSEAALRVETAHKLALALIAKYDIQARNNVPIVQSKSQNLPMRMAQSTVQKLISEQAQEPKIMTSDQLRQVSESGEISVSEREAIMADAVSKHYEMVDQIAAEGLKPDSSNKLNDDLINGSIFSEGGVVPILEQERLLRLQKQQQAIAIGGKNSFRRGG